MKNGDRVMVYFGGFALGMLLVSFITLRREAIDAARAAPWDGHNAAMLEAGAEPLPEGSPEVLKNGRMIDFGLLPNDESPKERVWLLRFEDRYPNVRLVEEIDSGEVSIMAADQIKISFGKDQDVTDLKPMLDKLRLRLRMFNRKEGIAVIGVLHSGIGAVPETLKAIQEWSEIFARAEPDVILFTENL